MRIEENIEDKNTAGTLIHSTLLEKRVYEAQYMKRRRGINKALALRPRLRNPRHTMH